MSPGRINLQTAVVLLADPNPASLSIMSQTLSGFGAKHLLQADSFAVAKTVIGRQGVDLVICDTAQGADGEDGYDFVHWLRRCGHQPNAFAPVLMTSGHCSLNNVGRSRSCGANFIVAKPLSPRILIDRIFWVARENRPFVVCDSYVGPDRRFRNEGPPPGTDGRRATDLVGVLGAANEPNMSQDQIDSLMMPQRASL